MILTVVDIFMSQLVKIKFSLIFFLNYLTLILSILLSPTLVYKILYHLKLKKNSPKFNFDLLDIYILRVLTWLLITELELIAIISAC